MLPLELRVGPSSARRWRVGGVVTPPAWAVLRYDDVLHVSRRVDLFSSSLGGTMIPDAQEAELALLRLIATGSPAAPIERVGHRFEDQAHVDFNAGRDAALTG